MAVTTKIAQQQMQHVGIDVQPRLGDTSYDAATNTYRQFDGHDWAPISGPMGSITSAGTLSIGANGPAGPLSAAAPQSLHAITNGSWMDNGITPANTLSFETDHGRVTLDIKTGDLTLPVGMAKDENESQRIFWQAFQKYFNCGNEAVYERSIKLLEEELAKTKTNAALMKQESQKEAGKRIADKFRKKYGDQKLIMVKPEDLAKFLEQA